MEKAIGYFEFKGKRTSAINARVETAIKWLWKIAATRYRTDLHKIFFDYEAKLLVATDGRILGLYHVPKNTILDSIDKSCYILVNSESFVAIEQEKSFVNYDRVLQKKENMILGTVKTIDYGMKSSESEFNLSKYSFDREVPVLYKALPNVVDLKFITMLKGFIWEFYYSSDYRSGRPLLFVEKYASSDFGLLEAVIMPMAIPFTEDASTTISKS